MIPNNVYRIASRFIPNMNQFQNVNTPDEFAQKLLESGKYTQQQVNQAKQMWNTQPNVQQMIYSRYGF